MILSKHATFASSFIISLNILTSYEQVAAMGTQKMLNHEDLLVVIIEISKDHQKSFHHPILSDLKSTFK